MTYVSLHGTLTNIEKGEYSDGVMTGHLMIGSLKEPWDFEKIFLRDAEEALVDGNYFNEKEGGTSTDEITEEDRKFIHDKYLALIKIIKEQLNKNNRFDIDILGYFEPNGADTEWCISRLRTVIENISRGCIKSEHLITIMTALDETGY